MRTPRRPSIAVALAIAAALSGCGKSTSAGGGAEGPGAVTPAGAGGLITANTSRLGGSDPVLDAAAVARAVHPGLTPQTRPQVVVLADEHDLPGALAAAVLSSIPLGAPVLLTEGDHLPAASADALAAMRPTGLAALGGAQTIEIGTSASPPGYRTHALSGVGPYDIAAEIQQLASALLGERAGSRAIVVDGSGPPSFAMPAAALAAESGAPILFTDGPNVPAATTIALARMGRPAIYTIGPPSAIGAGVLGQLRRLGAVHVIAGEDPASNAVAVAHYTDGSFGWGITEPGHGLVFASAGRPLDAAAAASLSASGDFGPLLLLESPNQIPEVLSTFLDDIRPRYPEFQPTKGFYNHGWLIGGTSVISAVLQAKLDATLEISP
jgi:hypothetical protein